MSSGKNQSAGKDFEMNANLGNLIHDVNLITLFLDKVGRIIFCNPYLLTLTGYSREELIGTNWFSIMIPEDMPDIRDLFLNGMETGDFLEHFENPILKKNRELIYIKWNNTVLRNSQEEIVGVASFGENITEQKIAEKALQRSEQEFQILTEVAPVGIFRTDENGKTLYVNPEWCKISGLSYNEALDDGWMNAVHPEDRDSIRKGWAKAIKDKTTSFREYRFLKHDNSITWVYGQSTPQMDSNGKIYGYIGTIIDITERKHYEETLSFSEEKFNKAFHNSPDAITITRAKDGLLVEVNESVLRMSGYSREEIFGNTSTGLDLWADEADRDLYVKTLKEKGRITDFETDLRTKTGEIRRFLISGENYQMNGEDYILGILRDITEQRLAEEKLQETEYIYSLLVSQLPQKIYIKDKDSNYLTCNESFASELGITTRELVGKSDFDFFPEESALKYRAEDQEVMNNGIVRDTEEKFYFGGEEKWIHSVKLPYRDASNQIAGVLGIFEDFSERKQTMELLQYQTQLLNQMGRVAKIGGWEFNPETGKGTWTDEVARIHDLDPVDETSMELGMTFYHGENREKIEKALKDAIEEGKSYDLELQMISAKGIRKWIHTIGYPVLQDGKVVSLRGSFQDISERIMAEEALLISERKYRKIFENVQDVFYQIDMQGIVTEISPSIYRLAGYTRADIIGKSAEIFYYNPEERKQFVELVFSQKEIWDFEVQLLLKDGSWRYASLNAHVMLDKKYEPVGIEGTIRDIGERKKFENDIIHAKERAEESDRLKTAFLHNISHEIRTPMNSIIGFSDLLGNPGNSPEVLSTYSDTIRNSSKQLLSIIDDIINISSIEAKVIKPSVSVLDINATLKDLYQQFSLASERKNISLEYTLGLQDEEAVIHTDTTKFIQIISNLINNALKFTDSGKLEFGYIRKESVLEFFVSDTGVGIPPDQHLKIFDTFYQVHHRLNRAFEGTGLGLSICKAYVELAGGKIWLESEPGKGSVFFFTLPYKQVKVNDTLEPVPDSYIQQELSKPYTILVAEDDDNNFGLIEIYLTDLNIKTIRAVSGEEAIQKCKSISGIDLVLMDIKMPGVDGYTATKSIREFLPELPIIAQTAYAFDRKKAYESGCTDFISKPFTCLQLNSIIKKALKQ